MTLKDLEPGKQAIVESVANGNIGNRLQELGCTPGETVSVERVAPFGGTIAIRFLDLDLCIRSNEADQVSVRLLD